MSAETAILLADVSKRFKFSTDEAESILDAIISSVRRKSHRHEQILWAVKDVSFSVQSGESVALVGLNGSGKSTILKLAAGIMRPSDGRIEVRGRLSALLELGAGFHPDLTGQENIWLNASILGLTNAEIGEIYDQIVDFSELGEFINMPVKHYSSGMYMRLGFSVAVHIDPDVLLIDEILAVGDQSFQDKCVERLAKLKAAGTTVVFVSHNPATVLSLCERAIWIEDGQMVADGPSQEIVRDYLASQESWHDESSFEAPEMPPISGDIELVGIRLCGASGRDQDVYEVGEEMTIEVDYLAQRPVDEVEFDLSFRREDGAYAGGPTGLGSGLGPALDQGRGTVRCRIDTLPLPPAAYHISASVFAAGGQTVHDHRERLATFQVIEAASGRSGELLRIPATWESISRSAEPLVEAPAAAASGAAGLGAGGISSETNS